MDSGRHGLTTKKGLLCELLCGLLQAFLDIKVELAQLRVESAAAKCKCELVFDCCCGGCVLSGQFARSPAIYV